MDIIPQHIAIIMDGNGRWAKQRLLPRIAGHIKGVSALKKIVNHCNTLGIKYLTVFAFSRENWQRPKAEVSFLMKLMLSRLNQELSQLHAKNARLCFLGDKSRLNPKLTQSLVSAETLTCNNTGLQFNICVDYSGQYDIIQAVNQIIAAKIGSPITPEIFAQYLLTSGQPNPELIIRTSGEYRISNFLLWQSAYSEFYFSNKLWPDFTPAELDQALNCFQARERRYGKTSEQLKDNECLNNA
jgi:undecaprenyl diphosphate synthase